MAIRFENDVRFNAEVQDSDGEAGTSGQILSSTGTKANWIDIPLPDFTIDGDLGSGPYTISGASAQTFFVGGTGIFTTVSQPAVGSGQITFNLSNTGVTAASYTSANITVDAQGRITAASNGSGGSGVSGSGTVGTIPIWETTTSNLGNSPIIVSTNNLDIPQYIRHIGDTNTYFGFPINDRFTVGVAGGEKFRVTSTTTNVYNSLLVSGDLDVQAGLKDSADTLGTSGQVLSSTGTNVQWITPGGSGTMDDWRLSVDTGLSYPRAISDGDLVTIAGGTNISTVGSASVNTVTINQDQYYQTFHFNSTDKGTGGTYYMEWDSAGAQNTVNQQSQYIPLRNGDFTKIKWFSNIAVSGNITISLYNNTTSLWTSGNFTSSANTAVNFTPNVAISENQRLNLRVAYPSGYSGGFNITAEFAWDL